MERRSNASSLLLRITTRSTSLPTPQSPLAYEPKYPTATTPSSARPVSWPHARTARSTTSLSGHLRTDESKDLTGMRDGLLALEGAVVLERRSLGVTVRIPRRDVEGVELLSGIDQVLPHAQWELLEQPCDRMTPRLLAPGQVQGLHGL